LSSKIFSSCDINFISGKSLGVEPADLSVYENIVNAENP